MAKVTAALLLVSTTVLFVAFFRGVGLLHGSADVESHFTWGVAALFTCLGANLLAIVHALASDRRIRELRRALEGAGGPSEGQGL
ncbi:MAG: hypothetical protein KatS3mg076_1898 [Candidatus Binatia bacterium]|nr:MAG: hypothetical protein KatS3mg076_1898 [Candidatus Binatia bacterium]